MHFLHDHIPNHLGLRIISYPYSWQHFSECVWSSRPCYNQEAISVTLALVRNSDTNHHQRRDERVNSNHFFYWSSQQLKLLIGQFLNFWHDCSDPICIIHVSVATKTINVIRLKVQKCNQKIEFDINARRLTYI